MLKCKHEWLMEKAIKVKPGGPFTGQWERWGEVTHVEVRKELVELRKPIPFKEITTKGVAGVSQSGDTTSTHFGGTLQALVYLDGHEFSATGTRALNAASCREKVL